MALRGVYYDWNAEHGALTPILVESIKELKTEKDTDVESLKKENANLQNQVDELQKQIDAIKNQMGAK